jgi:transcriptional regulator with XRE-family HTH domain
MVNDHSPSQKKTNANELATQVGNRLQYRRAQLRLNKGAIALRLGVPLLIYEAFERGEYSPSAAQLARLAELLEVPVLYFFENLPLAETKRANDCGCRTEESIVYTVATEHDRVAAIAAVFQRLPFREQQCLLSIADALARGVKDSKQ